MLKIVASALIAVQVLTCISIPLQALEIPSSKETKEPVAELKTSLLRQIQVTSGIVRTVAISSDGQTILSGDDEGKVQFWSLKTGKLIRTLPKHLNWVQSVAISPDGKTIASASIDSTIKLWNFNGQLLRTLKNHKAIYSLFWSPDGKFIASGDGGGQLKLWDLRGKLIRNINAHPSNVVSISISPNGKVIASRSFKSITDNNEEIKLWDLNTGKLIRSFAGGASGGVNSLAISPQGNSIAGYQISAHITNENSYSHETIKIWRLQSGEVINTLNVAMERPHAIAFSHDGKSIAIGGFSNKIEVWNVATGKQTTTLPAPHQIYSLTYSPDDKTLISSGSRSIAIWSISR
jgi:WD40 repeat protein